MTQTSDQSSERDIFNLGQGTVNVNNFAPLTEIDITLDESPPPCYHWQTRREEAQILADLTAGVQLVEIIGVGGYGKSALATRVFEQAVGFQKKFWVSFRPLFSEEFPAFPVFGRWFGRKFGYRPDPNWTDEQLATEALNRLTQNRCLLVLDNLETLLDPTGQWRDVGYRNFLLRWFGTGGGGVLLMTSRERPHLPPNTLNQTRWYPIGGLPIEAGIALLTDQQVQGSQAELREYVALADGHPLLLNLTVGFLKNAAGDRPQISVLKRAEFKLFEMVGLHRNDPETSIKLILDASLQRLEQELRIVLFEICLFPMPFSQKLLKVARDSTATEDQLRQLAKRSLLLEIYQSEDWTFQFQPLIRNYLQQQLLTFYREVGDRLGEANTLKAIGDVLQFLDRRGEALNNYEQAIGIYREVGARLGEANILQAFGKLQDDPAQGLDYLNQAQEIYQSIGDQYSQSLNSIFIAICQEKLQKIEAAIQTLQQAAHLAAEIGYEPLQTHALGMIAELQQPTQKTGVFKLNKWHYLGLGFLTLILVLVVRWLTHR
jgi:tetratricopeptide (TPR) repeat protein